MNNCGRVSDICICTLRVISFARKVRELHGNDLKFYFCVIHPSDIETLPSQNVTSDPQEYLIVQPETEMLFVASITLFVAVTSIVPPRIVTKPLSVSKLSDLNARLQDSTLRSPPSTVILPLPLKAFFAALITILPS